jgi:hypothetical protein
MHKIFPVAVVFILMLSYNGFSQTAFTSSNLPIITINTNGQKIVNEPKITAQMGIIYNGSGKRNYITDSCNLYNGYIGIEIRGQSSASNPKLSYGLETRDVSGNNLDVSLFGMPADNDWVLYASYSDKTLMRNVLSYKLSNDMGNYAARTQYCELILNGEYIGVYVFMEKIKRGKGRVNIKKLEAGDTSGNDLTGGYIVKIDKQDDGQEQGWQSSVPPYRNAPVSISYLYVYPKQEDIIAEQKNYIKKTFDNFESAISSTNYAHPFLGYYDYIDMPSFVDCYILFEFIKNVDAYRLSTFFYKDKNSVNPKIKYGPIWDMDFGFGNCDYDNASLTNGWEVLYSNNSLYVTPSWNKLLISEPVFFNALCKRWNQVKNTVLSASAISAFIDTTAVYLDEAKTRNFAKWKILGKYVWPNYYVGATYAAETNYLKTWIANRTAWLNSMLPSTYSDITWLSQDASLANLSSGVPFKIAKSKFYSNPANVDSVYFFSKSDSLKVINNKDSVTFIASAPGSYLIKAAGYRNNKINLISSAYTVTSSGISAVDDNLKFPDKFSVEQNYPNPFNPTTVINYQIAKAGKTEIKVYDLLGKEVAVLVNGYSNAGSYSVIFNAANLPSGVYYYRITSNGSSETRKMILMK